MADEKGVSLVPVFHPRPTIRWGLVTFLGLLFALALNLWVSYTELYSGAANIAGGNPPVPVLLALALLFPLRSFLKLSKRELMAFYLFATFSFIPTTLGGVRAFFPSLTTPFYYATPENRLKEFWMLLPDWWTPKEPVVIRGFFEGAEGVIPWGAWLFPLRNWTLFFTALWALSFGMAWLFGPGWLAHERLNFPLAQLPLRIVSGAEKGPLLRDSLAWTGIFVGALPTGGLVLCSLFRPVRRYWDLSPFFSDRLLRALQPILIYPLVEGVGFGYLVPQDVLFSVWFSYATLKLWRFLFLGLLGQDRRGFPYPTSQSCGGYLAMAFLLVLRGIRLKEGSSQRASFFLIGAGSFVLMAWMLLSGMVFPVAFLYWLYMATLALTYARVRAEVGMPYTHVFPYGAQRELLHLFGFGFHRLLGFSDRRSLVLLVGLFWVVRWFFLFLNGAYGADSVKIATETGLTFFQVSIIGGGAMLFGLWAAFFSHLRAYYRIGANFLEGAPGTGDYRTYVAAQDYRVLRHFLNAPPKGDIWRSCFFLYGIGMPLILISLRSHFPRFPLHPLGFVLGSAYGHHCPYWFPTLFLWAVKGMILRYGGMRLHARLIPFFLGLALGHYLMTGALWGGILSPLFKDRLPFPFRILFQ